jgi:2-polyprenyl-3-methyl-5-hydroxy-6-metoxy-1,4-benzoquinol methylase
MRDHVARTISTYDAIAKDYRLTATPDIRAWVQDSMRIFRTYLPGRRVLVPGSGDGRDSRYLSSLGLEVTSFDLSEQMLAVAKSLDSAGEYEKLDLRDMHSLNTTYDGVFASGCLYHLTKAEFTACLRDIHFLLNRNGVLYLNLKEGQGEGFRDKPGPNYPGGKRARAALKGQRFYAFYSPREMRSLLGDSPAPPRG